MWTCARVRTILSHSELLVDLAHLSISWSNPRRKSWRSPAQAGFTIVMSCGNGLRITTIRWNLPVSKESICVVNDLKMKINKIIATRVEQASRISSPRLLLLIFLFSSAVTIMYRPFSQLEVGDQAIYDYIAQEIIRGQTPYLDVVDIKGPLAAHLSALAMLGGKLVGIRDIIAVRLLHVLMAGLLSVVTYLVGTIYLKSRAAGVLAALVPLCFPTFIEMMVAGTQPKLPMMLFGMLSLLLI